LQFPLELKFLVVRLPERAAAAIAAATVALSPLPHDLAHASPFTQDGAASSPLIEELLRRTEANKEQNTASVKAVTESNAFTILDSNGGKNCAFDKCAPIAPKLEKAAVDPLQVMQSEMARVKQGLTQAADEQAATVEIAAPLAAPAPAPSPPPVLVQPASAEPAPEPNSLAETRARLLELDSKIAALKTTDAAPAVQERPVEASPPPVAPTAAVQEASPAATTATEAAVPAASEITPLPAEPLAPPALPSLPSPPPPIIASEPESTLPLSLPSLPSLPLEAASGWVKPELLPVVATSVLAPLGLFAALLLTDLLKAALALVSNDGRPKGADEPAEPGEEGTLAVPRDTFADELSVWPALLTLQESLAALPADEARRVKLEAGTNWPPRTSTARPFDELREGYMFFQGPTPLTSVQEGLAPFASRADLEGVQVPTVLKVLGGVGGASLLAVVALLVLG